MSGRITLVLLAVWMCAFAVQAQIQHPTAWLRADSAVLNASSWVDVSGNGYNATPSSGTMPAAFSRMNFNKCFSLSENESFNIPLTVQLSNSIDAIIVYETRDSVEENGLWELSLDSSSRIGLSSHCILNEHGKITYDTVNKRGAIINYLSQSLDRQPDALQTLSLSIADSAFLEGKLSEFLMFEHHIEDTSLTQWLSYLAIKYGITLYKSNYFDSHKHCIWNYETNANHSYSIAGIGRDDRMGLYQKQTLYADGHIIFGLDNPAISNEENVSVLLDGDFLVLGMDSNALQHPTCLYFQDGNEYMVVGRSVIQITCNNAAQYETFLQIDATLFADSLIPMLIVDHSGTGEYPIDETEFLYPNATDAAGNLIFGNLRWDSDGNGRESFCLAITRSDSITDGFETRAVKKENDDGEEKQSDNFYHLTPNPNSGQYRIEIELSEISDISVTISTANGKIVKTMSGQGKKDYVFDDFEKMLA